MTKNTKQLILKILVSGSLISLIVYKTDINSFINYIKMMDLKYVPFIILFLILNYVIGAFRWKKMLIYDNTEHITVKYLTNLYFTGAFFNNFMPTSIGGDVYKFIKLGKKINSTTNAFSATFMERFTGVFVLALIGIFGLVTQVGWWTAPLFILFIGGFFFGVWLLGKISKRFKKIEKFYTSLVAYKGKNNVIIWALVSSVIVQLLAIFTQYFVFLSIGIKLPLLYSFFVIPVITLAGFFIPSINGLGVQDALYIQFFGVVGISSEIALSASVIYHLSRLVVSLIGGVLYALGKDA